jgi:hypothetical protein
VGYARVVVSGAVCRADFDTGPAPKTGEPGKGAKPKVAELSDDDDDRGKERK